MDAKYTGCGRMTYEEVYEVITQYAPSMQKPFADPWGRFPEGGTAAMIVNYLSDIGQSWYNIDETIARKIIGAASEIIVRCG